MKADRVLVPLDGSPFAERALPQAVELLNGARASLILLRAAKVAPRLGVDPIEAQAVLMREAGAYLEAVAARLYDQGVMRVVRSVWYSSPAKAIVDAARVRRVNVIVMATRGRGGLGRLLGGSVAESVLRSTATPIVLVSAADRRLDPVYRTGAAEIA